MPYTVVTQKYLDSYYAKFHTEDFNMKQARSDVTSFAYYMLGIKLFPYQDMIVNDPSKRVAVCSSRQIGKTLSISIMALHEALFTEGRSVTIISHTLDQAKKVLAGIRDLMYQGDTHMKTFGKVKYFTNQINTDSPNTVTQLTLKNKSIIRSLPSTEAARGYSTDLLILDEAAFIGDEVFEKILEPQVLFTGGRILLASTPNGQQGFFYKKFDPESEKTDEEREYKRYWFPHSICDNENIRTMITRKEAELDKLTFSQEYEAQFTTSKSTFFDGPAIDNIMTEEGMLHTCSEPCYAGIDWGYKSCHTVITVGKKEGNKFKIIYQHEFPTGWDNRNIVDFFKALKKDFNIKQIITDDCGLAEPHNNELEEQDWDMEVIRFDFNRQKISTYMSFLDWVNRGDIILTDIHELVKEMRALRYERMDVSGIIRIRKPETGFDDRCDSTIMSFFGMLDEIENGFQGSLLV